MPNIKSIIIGLTELFSMHELLNYGTVKVRQTLCPAAAE